VSKDRGVYKDFAPSFCHGTLHASRGVACGRKKESVPLSALSKIRIFIDYFEKYAVMHKGLDY